MVRLWKCVPAVIFGRTIQRWYYFVLTASLLVIGNFNESTPQSSTPLMLNFWTPIFFLQIVSKCSRKFKNMLVTKKKSPHILYIKAHIGNLCMYVAGYFCIPTPPKRFDWSSPNSLWRSNYLMLWNWWRRRIRPRPVVGVAAHKEAADAARTRWRCSGVLSTLWRGSEGGQVQLSEGGGAG